MALPPKDPSAILPYGVNWADWFLQEGITSVTFTWTVPEGLENAGEEAVDGVTEQINPGTTVDNSLALITLASGTAGTKYKCICHLQDDDSVKADDRSITITVKER